MTGTTSEDRQVDKRAKIRTPSKEKEDAAEEESEGEDERSDSDYAEEEEQEGEGGEEEHRHARERAKTRSPSKGKKRATPKGKKRAAPEGARTSKAAKAAKKQKTSASACQVRRELGIRPVRTSRARAAPTSTAQFTTSNVVMHDSNRRHRQGGRLRSIKGFTEIMIQETGSRESR